MRKPLKGTIFSALILLSIIFLGTGCTKTPTAGEGITPPLVVTMNIISTLTQTSAISGGAVTNTNSGVVTADGVCWSSSNQTPDITDSKTSDSTATGKFTSLLTGLTSGTTYYLRAYATNAGGTGYGSVITFKTNSTSAIINATVSTIAGNTAGSYGFQNGAGLSALFNGPQAISFNPIAGNLYISDTFNNLIRTMTTAGAVSSLTNPALGWVDGPLSSALFYAPATVAFDAQGNAYVADLGNNIIRKITTAGVVSTLAGNGLNGYVDGPALTAEFSSPSGIAVDSKGTVYVADRGNNIIREVSPSGTVTSLAGLLAPVGASQNNYPNYLDGTTSASAFNGPCAVAIDGLGNLYVADINNRAIRSIVVSTGVVTTIAGNPEQRNVVGAPVALATDAANNLYIADESGRILEITAAHTLYVLAGSLNTAGYVDGPGASALFNNPQGVAVDAQGNVYATDFNNNVIRKITIKIQ